MPRVSDCLDALSGSTVFSTMDVTSAYNNVPVHPDHIPKTAFCSKYGLFEYEYMPFGMVNSGATFQRLIELVLGSMQWHSAILYVDDIICHAKDFEQHLDRLRQIFIKLRAAGLKLKPRKCVLFQTKVEFLGHVVDGEGIRPNPDNVAKLINWPTPKTQTDVRGILGLASYYRRFIKSFSQIVKPLTELTKKLKQFEWTEECQVAFDEIKRLLTSPPVMAYPKPNCPYILDTDASNFAIGAVLSQVQDGVERVIAYGSRTLNKSEVRYCVTDRELLAVKYFVEYYKYYLLGQQFLVRSDHQALRWLFSLKEPKDRIARWIEILSQYSFALEYRKGDHHGNADGLSRCPNPRDCSCPDINDELKCGPCTKCNKRASDMLSSWYEHVHVRRVILRSENKQADVPPPVSEDMSALLSKQLDDPDISPIIKWLRDGKRPFGDIVCSASPTTRHYWNYWNSLVLKNGVLFRKFLKRDGTETYYHQFLVPRSMRSEILQQNHNALLAGHLGKRKTEEKILRNFYWFGLRDDVGIWISQCDSCASIKPPHKTPRAPLGTMPVGDVLDRLSTDILGPFPESERKNKYILVVSDHFSKWVEIFAVPDQTAPTCARLILNEVIARFGCPLDLHSDQGRNYESHIFAELCKLLEIRKTRTASGNAKCNGQTERFNRTLVRMIKAYLRGEQTKWDDNLGCLAAAYRATPHETTGFSPNLLMLGREVRLPSEIMFGSGKSHLGEEISSYGQYVTKIRERLQKAHDVTRTHLQTAANRRKDYYDAKCKDPTL
jgi:hypothetical protein